MGAQASREVKRPLTAAATAAVAMVARLEQWRGQWEGVEGVAASAAAPPPLRTAMTLEVKRDSLSRARVEAHTRQSLPSAPLCSNQDRASLARARHSTSAQRARGMGVGAGAGAGRAASLLPLLLLLPGAEAA